MAEATTVDAGIPGMFVNPEVPLDSLPGTETLDWAPLHPRFARRLQVSALIRAVLIIGAWSAFHLRVVPFVAEFLPWLATLGWTTIGAFCLWSLVWPLVAVPRRGYVVSEKDLLYKSGVLWRSVKAFPFNRVQHTKLDSTPLDPAVRPVEPVGLPGGGGRGSPDPGSGTGDGRAAAGVHLGADRGGRGGGIQGHGRRAGSRSRLETNPEAAEDPGR